jgi:lipopolysaccharide biosynthesis glycosyltransferase
LNLKPLAKVGTGSVDIHVAISACGKKYGKSALVAIRCVYTAHLNVSLKSFLHVHYLHDENATEPILVIKELLSQNILDSTSFGFYPRLVGAMSKGLLLPYFRGSVCASTRLLPNDLVPETHIKTMIYLDADTCMLGNPYHMMMISKLFSGRQFAAFSPEEPGWYTSGHSGPEFYGKTGINSGVAVFDVIKWKSSSTYESFLSNYSIKYHRIRSPLGDQDVLNRYFASHP